MVLFLAVFTVGSFGIFHHRTIVGGAQWTFELVVKIAFFAGSVDDPVEKTTMVFAVRSSAMSQQ